MRLIHNDIMDTNVYPKLKIITQCERNLKSKIVVGKILELGEGCDAPYRVIYI